MAYNSKNHLPLLWRYFKDKRATLFNLMDLLQIQAPNQNKNLINAMNYICDHRQRRSDHIEADGSLKLSFLTEEWKKLIFDHKDNKKLINRKHLEVCIFSNLTSDLKSGDAFVPNADSYSDFRKNLLEWSVCETYLSEFCKKTELPDNKSDFVNQLKQKLRKSYQKVNSLYPDLSDLFIN